ncbi:tetratricopeptide repeat-containing sensor histidine kinase [Flavobacterium caeni]|uniref:Tetratricopeptide repeat-containing protein n=1 Tax=Flavobacterium caeni TaxID=490189 RepID=A0A1G5ANQ9_9FLAO|nr:tetratricopeptide repeat protein [Flavobacterium caeni]SCX79450.1 Tetratricopeptide repeat-containing protein [Flavobacterium caeni]
MSKQYFLAILFFAVGWSAWSQQTEVDSLKRVLAVTRIDTAKVNLYNALAYQFRETNVDSAQTYAGKALALAQQKKYFLGIAHAHLNLGNAHIILSDYPTALRYFLSAQKQFESAMETTGNPSVVKGGMARALASAGVVYSEQNNYPKALEQYFKALKMYQEIGQKQGVSKAYNNIAVVYKSEGHLQQALSYLEKAYAIQTQIGEQSAPVTLTNIGAIHFEIGNDVRALEYYRKAEKQFASNANKRGEALLHSYLGDYYRKQKDVEKALVHYDHSQKMYTALGNQFGTALVQYQVGLLHYQHNRWADALLAATQSLDLARQMGTLDQIKESEKLLSDIYTQTGDQTRAFAHYKQYIAVKDSLENNENAKKFVRAEMDFEYDKKEALLREQTKRHQQFLLFLIIGGLLLLTLVFVTYNRLQIKRRLTLQKEVAEYEQKALHLQMNPHFVFNCLGSISSFIVQNGTDSAIKYLSKFSKLMRLTLEYSKGSLIPIDKEIEALQNYLELEQLRFNKKFDFTITASPDIEDDMALPPLLIQPFVENAILHGMVPKEGNGSIDVRFDVRNNQLVCTITDDGIGYQTSKTLKENSVTAHQSMALDITKKRLEMMEATTSQSAQVTIEEIKNADNQTSGTKAVILLPIQYTADTKPRI